LHLIQKNFDTDSLIMIIQHLIIVLLQMLLVNIFFIHKHYLTDVGPTYNLNDRVIYYIYKNGSQIALVYSYSTIAAGGLSAYRRCTHTIHNIVNIA
jgi:hypothetical protein